MVAPAVYLAVAAGTAIMQMYNSERQRGADRKRLKEIEAMFSKIVPPEYDIKVYDSPELLNRVDPAKFDFSKLTPKEYASVGEYKPEVANFMREQAPQTIRASDAATKGRSAQMDALRQYQKIASGEFNPELAQMLNEASRRSQKDAQSRQAAIMQGAQRRGIYGAGAGLMGEMNAGEDAMLRQAQDSQSAASEAYRQRLEALGKSASLGGDIRDSEMTESGKNVDIINDYNQRSTKAYQDWANLKAAEMNKASIFNLNKNQAISDANVEQGNEYDKYNQTNFNKLQDQMVGYNQNTATNNLNAANAKNSWKGKGFEDQINLGHAKTGNIIKASGMQNKNTLSENQDIQSAGDLLGMGAAAYMNAPQSSTRPNYGSANTTANANYSPNTGVSPLDQNQSYQTTNTYNKPYGYDDWVAEQKRKKRGY